jgi:hypothetical protein
VEKVLNRWLDEERPAAPELIAMLGDAEHEFRRWWVNFRARARCRSTTGS